MNDHPMPPPELSELDQLRADNESLRYSIERARWALSTDEPINERLQRAEIRAAVSEHSAAAYREQVQALVRSIQREHGVPEDQLGGEAFVVVSDKPLNHSAGDYNDVQGRCPACGGTSLFLGDGGYVTCLRVDCPEPNAASTLLDNRQCTAENHSNLPVRCIMPVRHDGPHADGGGFRWTDSVASYPTSTEGDES